MTRATVVTLMACSLMVAAVQPHPGFVARAASVEKSEARAESLYKAEDDFQLVKVAEGVYAAIAKQGGLASGNAGFVIGDGGVLVVDTFLTPIAVGEMLGEIGKLTNQPIKYALNTHYHLDHTGGNQVFEERHVPIIAHDNVVKWETSKNRRFLPPSDDLKKRRADAETQLKATPEDQKEKRTQLERQIARLDAMIQ